MGTTASLGKATAINSDVLSPRLQTAKGKTDPMVVLDSLSLAEVDSGTIHYRYKAPDGLNDFPELINENIGYFYHPKLKDYSELGDQTNEETYKFIRVNEGPESMRNRKVFYVCGIGFDSNLNGMPPSLLYDSNSPQRGNKRIYGHKYYTLSQETDPGNRKFIDEVAATNERLIWIKASPTFSVKDIKRKLGHQLICPVAVIHLSIDEELSDDEKIGDVLKIESYLSEEIILKLQA